MAISQTDYFGFIEISLQGFWWTRNDSNANKVGGTARKSRPKRQFKTTTYMTNESITLRTFKKYFDLKEVVSKQVYERYGQQAWQFLDPRLLAVVVWLRQNLGIPLVCNNWYAGGQLDERGFRANLDPLVLQKTKAGKLYCSAHCRGQAIDLSSGRMTAEQMRRWIRQHREDLPYPVRMEKDVNWLHLDVANTTTDILVEFKG